MCVSGLDWKTVLTFKAFHFFENSQKADFNHIQAIQQINDTKVFDDTTDHQGLKSFDQSEISSVSSRGMSKLQRRQSGSFRKRSDMGRFNSLPSGVGSVQSESRYSAMSTRPYSPAPLIEFLPEIDFSDPLFIGDSATQMLPIHANVPMGFIPQSFIKVNLNFRSGNVSDIF